ncbi:MAG: hypothetical protein AAF790_09420 [Planctomycetota bacterium]
MSEILFQYQPVNPTTWAYLSSLLSLALFFKFSRLWTLRNLDLLLLILLAPALLCIKLGMRDARAGVEVLGYAWLFAVNTLLLVRMLIDPALVRRPLLEPNLTVGGTAFLGASLLLFLAGNVMKGKPTDADTYATQRAEFLADLREAAPDGVARGEAGPTLKSHGPGSPFLYLLPHIETQPALGGATAEQRGGEYADASGPNGGGPDGGVPGGAVPRAGRPIAVGYTITAKVMAVLSQTLIVVGMVLIAARHFDNAATGISAASLYLMLPYTAMWTGGVTHALPGALLVWAVLCYRRPVVSGLLFGLLCGLIYYPLFLLPLWVTFYWRRGAKRFGLGVAVSLAVLIVTLAFPWVDAAEFFARVRQMFNLQLPVQEGLAGAWHHWNASYRLPLLALFVGLSFSFILWPAQKNLGTLLSCSAALMIGTQFWHAHSGGMALAWCLPVMLLTIFRPNLEDRVAVDVVSAGRRR